MKDYTETEYQKQFFILKYEIDSGSNEIVVYYADGNIQRLPFSASNEKVLLERMKRQITDYSSASESAKNDMIFHYIAAIFSLVLAGGLTFALASQLILAISVGIAGIGLTPTVLINFLGILATKKGFDKSLSRVKEAKLRLEDFNKNLFYLAHEDFFTKGLELSKKAKEKRKDKDASIKIPGININSINDISFDELKSVYNSSNNIANNKSPKKMHLK